MPWFGWDHPDLVLQFWYNYNRVPFHSQKVPLFEKIIDNQTIVFTKLKYHISSGILTRHLATQTLGSDCLGAHQAALSLTVLLTLLKDLRVIRMVA